MNVNKNNDDNINRDIVAVENAGNNNNEDPAMMEVEDVRIEPSRPNNASLPINQNDTEEDEEQLYVVVVSEADSPSGPIDLEELLEMHFLEMRELGRRTYEQIFGHRPEDNNNSGVIQDPKISSSTS